MSEAFLAACRERFGTPPPPRVQSIESDDYDSAGFDCDGYDKEGIHQNNTDYYFWHPWYCYENREEEGDYEEYMNEVAQEAQLVEEENWDLGSFDGDYDLDIPAPIPQRWEIIDQGEEADDEDEGYDAPADEEVKPLLRRVRENQEFE